MAEFQLRQRPHAIIFILGIETEKYVKFPRKEYCLTQLTRRSHARDHASVLWKFISRCLAQTETETETERKREGGRRWSIVSGIVRTCRVAWRVSVRPASNNPKERKTGEREREREKRGQMRTHERERSLRSPVDRAAHAASQ